MRTTLFQFTYCDMYFNEYGVSINEDLQACYGGSQPDKFPGSCDGDSGSPIFHQDYFGNVVCLIGINSFVSKTCDDGTRPTVSTIVSSVQKWIAESLLELDSAQSSETDSSYSEQIGMRIVSRFGNKTWSIQTKLSSQMNTHTKPFIREQNKWQWPFREQTGSLQTFVWILTKKDVYSQMPGLKFLFLFKCFYISS